MSPVVDVDTFPPGEASCGERGGLSIKETGAGNRAPYSQHKPPTQKSIEMGQEGRKRRINDLRSETVHHCEKPLQTCLKRA